MMKIIDVKKTFGGNIILNKLNLDINSGEVIHIKGNNGCGKSTLLKIMAGLIKPDHGDVVLNEGVTIGALIENPCFIEDESAVQNLKFLYNLTGTYDELKVKELFRQFHLDYNAKVRISKYSVGMRQKVGIIQAIMENQNLILLDEPTRGLDSQSISNFNSIINTLHCEGKMVVICAHDGVEGINFTRSYRLENGGLVKECI